MRGALSIGVLLVVLGVTYGSRLWWAAGCLVVAVQVGADVMLAWSVMRGAGPHRAQVAAALLAGRFLSWPGRWVLRRMASRS